MKVCNRHRSPG